MLHFISHHEKQFVRLVLDKSKQEQARDTSAKKRAAAKHRRRIAEIDTLIERLYMDNVSGKVPDERYYKMSSKLEEEQVALTLTLAALETELAAGEEQAAGVDSFLDTVRRYTEIETLTPAIIHEFIDKVVVYEPEQARGNRIQNIEIVYNKIGAVDLDGWWSDNSDTSA